MTFWKKLLGPRSPPPPSLGDPSFSAFLEGWGFELRSSRTPPEELRSEMSERFFEHFPDVFDAPTEQRLLTELQGWTDRFLAAEQSAEQAWSSPTDNDRLTAAFEALRARDLVALEDAGVTLQDGWGEVGLEQRRAHRGAVFFHQQDILDVLRGQELLLAFGAFEERPGAPTHQSVGREVMEALTLAGLSARWSGDAGERIRLAPFRWQKRRWSPSPEVPAGPRAPTLEVPLGEAERRTPDALRPENASAFTQPVTAVRSSAGFHVHRADTFAALWRRHGGVRGQLCHVGPPHVFVPAGQQTSFGVRNAYLNLEPAEASAVRRRGRRAVIAEERRTVFRAPPWPRPLWSAGGAPGRVGLLVVSATPLAEQAPDDSPVDLTEWSPYAEMPEGLHLEYSARDTQPERFTSLEQTARLAHEHASTGPGQAVLSRLSAARYGAMIQFGAADPADLGWLQFAWAVARWLLSRGDGVVFDIEAGQWWTRDDLVRWEAGGWAAGRRFLLEREVQFTSGPWAEAWFLGSWGLTKFGRPELLLRLEPERLDTTRDFATATVPAWGQEALSTFATRLALGVRLEAGEVLEWGTLKFTAEPCRPGVNAPADVNEGALVLVPASAGSLG